MFIFSFYLVTCEIVIFVSMSVFPECKVHIFSVQRGQSAVIVKFLFTKVRKLDQGLYLGHGNRDSVLAVRIGIGDVLFIAAYNHVIKIKNDGYNYSFFCFLPGSWQWSTTVIFSVSCITSVLPKSSLIRIKN